MQISKNLLEWYDGNKRMLPWRENADPYRVWVSEIMLQQTRVEAVIPYFNRFIELFPDYDELALAPLDKVYKVWEGLGYYSRARSLHKAAAIVSENGFPKKYADLQKLPGIGPYTAGAIASICFHEAVPAVDGNVIRVFSRLYAYHEPAETPSAKRQIHAWVKEALCASRPGDFNQALMELGATVCIPSNPRCTRCPLNQQCLAFENDEAHTLPVRLPKRSKVEEQIFVAIILDEMGRVLLRKRNESGLLGGFWEFPYFSSIEQIPFPIVKIKDLSPAKHVFTHRIWLMEGALFAAVNLLPPDRHLWADVSAFDALQIPSAMSHWLTCAKTAILDIPSL